MATFNQLKNLPTGSEDLEEAGTPNILGALRAAMAFEVKAAVGADVIAAREKEVCKRVLAELQAEPRLELLGNAQAERLPIFSFEVSNAEKQPVPHGLVCALLNDLFGV